jgi:hypothetical protein
MQCAGDLRGNRVTSGSDVGERTIHCSFEDGRIGIVQVAQQLLLEITAHSASVVSLAMRGP